MAENGNDNFPPPEIWREQIAPLLENAEYRALTRTDRRIWTALRNYIRPVTGSDIYIRTRYDYGRKIFQILITYESRRAIPSLTYNDLSAVERLVSAHERAIDAHAVRIHLILECVPDTVWAHCLLSDPFLRLYRRLHALVIQWVWSPSEARAIDSRKLPPSEEETRAAVFLPLSDRVRVYHMAYDHEYRAPESRHQMQRLHDAFESYHAVSTVYLCPGPAENDKHLWETVIHYERLGGRMKWHGAVIHQPSNEVCVNAQYIASLLNSSFPDYATVCRLDALGLTETPNWDRLLENDTYVTQPLPIAHKQQVPRDAHGTVYDTFRACATANASLESFALYMPIPKERLKAHSVHWYGVDASDITATEPCASAQGVYARFLHMFRICTSPFIGCLVFHKDVETTEPDFYPGALIADRDGSFVAVKLSGRRSAKAHQGPAWYTLFIHYRDALTASPEELARVVFGAITVATDFSASPDIQRLVSQWGKECLGEYIVKHVE
jgi:hypothetical protein